MVRKDKQEGGENIRKRTRMACSIPFWFQGFFFFLFFEALIALKHVGVFVSVPFLTLPTAQKGILKLSLHYLIRPL